MTSISEKCEALLAAYQEKGCVPPGLLPPVSKTQFQALTSWFPVPVVHPIEELYSWHNGQSVDAFDTDDVFWFRDMQFIPLAEAARQYASMMESYGADDNWNKEHHGIELRTCFPFASYNGGWFVLPCAEQTIDGDHPLPVICVFQGIDVYFYSMEAMLDTCIEWQQRSEWGGSSWELTDEDEMEIWQRHNPGIFNTAA